MDTSKRKLAHLHTHTLTHRHNYTQTVSIWKKYWLKKHEKTTGLNKKKGNWGAQLFREMAMDEIPFTMASSQSAYGAAIRAKTRQEL